MDKSYEDNELAKAYVKIQYYRQRWDPMEGLLRGTIFPELYRPYRIRREGESQPGARQPSYTTRTRHTAVMRGGKYDGRK